MSETSKPQFARVEQPFGCEPPVLHCPICGQVGLESGSAEPGFTACPHLAFVYVDSVGSFEYTSKEFERRKQALGKKEFTSDNFRKRLRQAGYDNKLLAIEVTFGGMACGPVWDSVVFGFDFGTLAGEGMPWQAAVVASEPE